MANKSFHTDLVVITGSGSKKFEVEGLQVFLGAIVLEDTGLPYDLAFDLEASGGGASKYKKVINELNEIT